MGLVNIAVASLSVKAGDFKVNKGYITDIIKRAQDNNVHLLVTPELGISGYSLEDRASRAELAQQSWATLAEISSLCDKIALFVGLPIQHDNYLYSATALIHNKIIHGLTLKKKQGQTSFGCHKGIWSYWEGGITEIHGVPAGELLFRFPFGAVVSEFYNEYHNVPFLLNEGMAGEAEIVCLSGASPFTPRVQQKRTNLLMSAAAARKKVYAFSNLLGTDNGRHIFEGGCLIATPQRLAASGPILSKQPWRLTSAVVDLARLGKSQEKVFASGATEPPHSGIIDLRKESYKPASLEIYVEQQPKNLDILSIRTRRSDRNPALDELFSGIALGLRDYFEKVGVFKKFLIGLSGGQDSALCLLLAVKAAKMLGAGKESKNYAQYIETVYLANGALSSDATRDAASRLAAECKVPFSIVSIEKEARMLLSKASEMTGDANKVTPITRQNLQARLRASMLLNWANSVDGLLLVTSNLSELAVGYSTAGGDNQGGYSPLANIPKTVVCQLLEYLSKKEDIKSLQGILALPPSAELEPGQTDEEDLMPYKVLDELLHLYLETQHSLVTCWRIACLHFPEYDAEQMRQWTADFFRRLNAGQWKRNQHPLSPKLFDLDLSPFTGFSVPIIQSIESDLEELNKATLN